MPTLPGPTSNTPPADDTTMPAPGLGDPMPSAGSPITLTKDQLTAAGLDDLAEGDTFTVTITAKVTSMDDNGAQADVSDASEGEVHSDEPGGSTDEDTGFQKPKSKIEMGPKDTGMKGF